MRTCSLSLSKGRLAHFQVSLWKGQGNISHRMFPGEWCAVQLLYVLFSFLSEMQEPLTLHGALLSQEDTQAEEVLGPRFHI
jgi:hypothetical protein